MSTTAPTEAPSWSTFGEAIRVVAYPPFLKKTSRTAVVVGSLLFSINHLDELLRGQANASTWIKGVATCLVPLAVANWGILIATRRPGNNKR